MLRTVE